MLLQLIYCNANSKKFIYCHTFLVYLPEHATIVFRMCKYRRNVLEKYTSKGKFSITAADIGHFRHQFIDFGDIEFGCLKEYLATNDMLVCI